MEEVADKVPKLNPEDMDSANEAKADKAKAAQDVQDKAATAKATLETK